MMKTGTMRSPSGGLVYIFGDVEKDKIEKRYQIVDTNFLMK